MLAWSERWRAVALAVPPVRPPEDEGLQADLAAMRDVSSRLSLANSLGLRIAPLQHEQQRLERAVRARALRTQGAGRNGAPRTSTRGFDVSGLLDALGDDRLLELVDVEGELHVLVCGDGKVRRFMVGKTEAAAREIGFARFVLRRLACGQPVPPAAEVHGRLTRMGETLERVLLGEAATHMGDGNVIVVPPGRLALRAMGPAVAPALPGGEHRALGVVLAPCPPGRLKRCTRCRGQPGGAGPRSGPGLRRSRSTSARR